MLSAMKIAIVGCVLVAMTSVVRADEAPKAADLTVGNVVFWVGVGPRKIQGISSKPASIMLRHVDKDEYAGSIDLDEAKNLSVVRALISKDEAKRRVALLKDTTPVTDARRTGTRRAEVIRTAVKGSQAEILALLRAQYASTFGTDEVDRKMIDRLEREVLPELAYVLGVSKYDMEKQLHAPHAKAGAFSTAAGRPKEPEAKRPVDPWKVAFTSEYAGTFRVEGPIVVGDPDLIPTKPVSEEVAAGVPTANMPATIAALAGTWHCYAELEPPETGSSVWSMIAIHESAKAQVAKLRPQVKRVARVAVAADRYSFAVIDSSVRDDPAFLDALVWGDDQYGNLAGRGCLTDSFGGTGTYTVRTLVRRGKAIAIHVDFTEKPRDFKDPDPPKNKY